MFTPFRLAAVVTSPARRRIVPAFAVSLLLASCQAPPEAEMQPAAEGAPADVDQQTIPLTVNQPLIRPMAISSLAGTESMAEVSRGGAAMDRGGKGIHGTFTTLAHHGVIRASMGVFLPSGQGDPTARCVISRERTVFLQYAAVPIPHSYKLDSEYGPWIESTGSGTYQGKKYLKIDIEINRPVFSSGLYQVEVNCGALGSPVFQFLIRGRDSCGARGQGETFCGVSPIAATCWCDSSCVAAGDCCPDYEYACKE